MDQVSDEKRRLPPWLWGLVIAAVLSAVALLVASAFGFGDDPAFDSAGAFFGVIAMPPTVSVEALFGL